MAGGDPLHHFPPAVQQRRTRHGWRTRHNRTPTSWQSIPRFRCLLGTVSRHMKGRNQGLVASLLFLHLPKGVGKTMIRRINEFCDFIPCEFPVNSLVFTTLLRCDELLRSRACHSTRVDCRQEPPKRSNAI